VGGGPLAGDNSFAFGAFSAAFFFAPMPGLEAVASESESESDSEPDPEDEEEDVAVALGAAALTC
jgi:hypothetical protein